MAVQQPTDEIGHRASEKQRFCFPCQLIEIQCLFGNTYHFRPEVHSNGPKCLLCCQHQKP
jgi:hypothetical protein